MSSTNEYSLRYSEPIDLFYTPSAGDVGAQSESNRQGRGDALSPEAAERVRELLVANDEHAMALYHVLADECGVARELARNVLPVSLYTRLVWSIDLHNLMHFLALRLDTHAQLEIRVFAQALADIAKAWVPVAYEDRAADVFPLDIADLTKAWREFSARLQTYQLRFGKVAQ